jgi:hypothetical protein
MGGAVMSDFDWKSLVRTVSPVLGSALGGPLAGAAIKLLADKVLGRPDATEDEVAQALAGGTLTGEQVLAIKQAELSFQLEMTRLEQGSEIAYLQDVQNARARQVETKDRMPQAILWTLMALYASQFAAFYLLPLPDDDFLRALILRAYATVEVGLTGAIAYFIGSSRGSKRQGDTVRAIAESTANK